MLAVAMAIFLLWVIVAGLRMAAGDSQ